MCAGGLGRYNGVQLFRATSTRYKVRALLLETCSSGVAVEKAVQVTNGSDVHVISIPTALDPPHSEAASGLNTR